MKTSFLCSEIGEAEWARYTIETEPDIGRVARREKLLGACVGVPSAILFGVMFGLFVATREPDSKRFGVLVGVIMAVPLVMYSARGGPWHKYRESLLALTRRGHQNPRSITVCVEADGVRVSDEFSSTVQHWNAFDRVVRLPNHLAINFSNAGSAIVIPNSAFAGTEDVSRWESVLRERMEAAGYSEGARVRAEIDAGPVLCGRCAHSLRGIRDPRCPECGTPLTTLTIRAWRTLQQPFWRIAFRRTQ